MKSISKWYVNHAARMSSRAIRSRMLSSGGIAYIGLVLFGCGSGGLMTSSQLQPQADTKNVRYNVTDLGQVGNSLADPGQPFVISNSGWVSGTARVGSAEHAILWRGGQEIDIGVPGLGGNSIAYGVNESGTVAGEAETTASGLATAEDFCGFEQLGFSSAPTPCVPVIWMKGKIVPLPTLGGVNGVANEINNSGDAAGYAENTTLDQGCTAPQQYQFEAVVWSRGRIQALPTVAGDNEGIAYSINDRGDAAGTTGDCAPFNPISLTYMNTAHAVLWQDGVATDLGNLGGTLNIFNWAHHINNHGDVVGGADAIDKSTNSETSHAFLWTQGAKMQDLGTLSGDSYSIALGINDSSEITGLSANADFSVIRAFIRRNGTLVDLNSLIADNPSGLSLATACSITSDGSIIGIAIDGSGATHAYLATPVNGASAGKSNIKPMTQPDAVRARFRSAMHI